MITELEGTITVPYEEVGPSPQEGLTDDGFEARRILECAFADRLTLAEQLRGGVRLVGGTYVYTRPQAYPHYPRALVHEVRVEPFGAAVAGASPAVMEYALARLTVTYRIPEHGEQAEQTLVSESLEPVVEFITMPHEKLYWDSQGTQQLSESESPGRLIRMLEWVYVRHNVINIPAQALQLVGKVNDRQMTSSSLQLAFPAETLLYNPPQLERDVTTEGVKAWKVTYRFTYRPETWNRFPRRGSESMHTIYKEQAGQFSPLLVYEPADFSAILG